MGSEIVFGSSLSKSSLKKILDNFVQLVIVVTGEDRRRQVLGFLKETPMNPIKPPFLYPNISGGDAGERADAASTSCEHALADGMLPFDNLDLGCLGTHGPFLRGKGVKNFGPDLQIVKVVT